LHKSSPISAGGVSADAPDAGGYARDSAAKRGNAPLRVSPEESLLTSEDRADELLSLDEALTRLAALDSEQASLVEMHVFGGMSFGDCRGADYFDSHRQAPMDLGPRLVDRPIQPGRRATWELCAANPDLRFEREPNGEIVILPLTDFQTGYRNHERNFQLTDWAKRDGRGIAVDSST
jgi:hypothetical protein